MPKLPRVINYLVALSSLIACDNAPTAFELDAASMVDAQILDAEAGLMHDAGSVAPDVELGPDLGPGPDATTRERSDAGSVAPDDEPFGAPVPDSMLDTFVGFGDRCPVAGFQIPHFGANIVDDCVICQCTTFGGRCARRVGCARDVCVFVDGTVLSPGESARVRGCFVCTCDEAGGRCVRDVEAPCPVDGCVVPYFGDPPTAVVPVGLSLFVSECHRCGCDAELGAQCRDVCHTGCFDVESNTEIPDQSRVPDPSGCGSCVCDYGDLGCDRRGCEE